MDFPCHADLSHIGHFVVWAFRSQEVGGILLRWTLMGAFMDGVGTRSVLEFLSYLFDGFILLRINLT